jgi:hypothetical protein
MSFPLFTRSDKNSGCAMWLMHRQRKSLLNEVPAGYGVDAAPDLFSIPAVWEYAGAPPEAGVVPAACKSN